MVDIGVKTKRLLCILYKELLKAYKINKAKKIWAPDKSGDLYLRSKSREICELIILIRNGLVDVRLHFNFLTRVDSQSTTEANIIWRIFQQILNQVTWNNLLLKHCFALWTFNVWKGFFRLFLVSLSTTRTTTIWR